MRINSFSELYQAKSNKQGVEQVNKTDKNISFTAADDHAFVPCSVLKGYFLRPANISNVSFNGRSEAYSELDADFENDKFIFKFKPPADYGDTAVFFYETRDYEGHLKADAVEPNLEEEARKCSKYAGLDNSGLLKRDEDGYFRAEFPDATNLSALSYNIYYPEAQLIDASIGSNHLSNIRQQLEKLMSESPPPPVEVITKGSVQAEVVVTSHPMDVFDYKGNTPAIFVVRSVEGSIRNQLQQNIPSYIKGIICSEGSPYAYAHFEAQLKAQGIVCAKINDEELLENIKSYEGSLVSLNITPVGIDISDIEEIEPDSVVKPAKIDIKPMIETDKLLASEDYTVETVGPKAANLRFLELEKPEEVKVPKSIAIPCGIFEKVLNAPENLENAAKYRRKIEELIHNKEPQEEWKLEKKLDEIKTVVQELNIPEDIQQSIKEFAEKNGIKGSTKMVRSSFNGEDVDGYSASGLYRSLISNCDDVRDCVQAERSDMTKRIYGGDTSLMTQIKNVWASKWNLNAYLSRQKHGIDHDLIKPAVIIQKFIDTDYHMAIDTKHPLTDDPNIVVIKLSKGISGNLPGNPFIFTYNKTTGEVERISLATKAAQVKMGIIEKDYPAYYHFDLFTKSKEKWTPLIQKIGKAAVEIEKKQGKPQDIEGGLVLNKDNKTDADVYFWQTRKLS